MANKKTQAVSPSLLLTIGVALLIIVGYGLYMLGAQNGKGNRYTALAPTNTPAIGQSISLTPIAIPIISPVSADTLLHTYYNWYVACLQRDFEDTNANPQIYHDDKKDCPVNKEGVLTDALVNDLQQAEDYNKVLCAQNIPEKVTFENAIVTTSGTATGVVHTIWGASPQQHITVGLAMQKGAWKISSITCHQ